MMVISKDNKVYLLWNIIHANCCMISCYFYMVFAAFENLQDHAIAWQITLGFEIVFSITTIISFFVEYTEADGQDPIRDPTMIAKNYLRTEFLQDFIPIIPL